MNSFPIFQPIFDNIFRNIFDVDPRVGNLETEDGFNLLQENGDLILLEDN